MAPVLDHPVPTQKRVELLGSGFAWREIRRGVTDRRRVLHHLVPPNFPHAIRDFDHLMKAGELRVPMQYLARAAGSLRQATVTFVDGVALADDGCARLEAELRFFEEVRRVFLIFVR